MSDDAPIEIDSRAERRTRALFASVWGGVFVFVVFLPKGVHWAFNGILPGITVTSRLVYGDGYDPSTLAIVSALLALLLGTAALALVACVARSLLRKVAGHGEEEE